MLDTGSFSPFEGGNMARRIKDKALDSREARSKLNARGKPYFRAVERGLHLGYRKLKDGAGTWVIRRYLGEQNYEVERLGAADDLSDADGVAILDFWQAQTKAREFMVSRAHGSAAGPAPTVRQAVEPYIAERDARETRRKGRPVRSDAHRLERYVIGRAARGKRKEIAPAKLAGMRLQQLEREDLRRWRASLPPTLSAASRERTTSDLKAALLVAYAAHDKRLGPTFPGIVKSGLITSTDRHDDGATTEVRENQILSAAQLDRAIRAAKDVDAERKLDGDLYRLVLVLAATGARFSQVARMRVGDVQRKQGRLLVPTSRKGKGGKKIAATPVPVGRDVLDALLPATTGRANDVPLLERWRHRQAVKGGIRWERDRRGPWQWATEIDREWLLIREQADLSKDIVAYSLRHTSIVRGLAALLPVQLVARLHDTSVAMIEKHYARWIAHGLEDLAAKVVVPLVPPEQDDKVVPLR
jgi:integrase